MNAERIIHSLKTGLACLFGFIVTKALHAYLSFDQWLIVTILVVMCAQISVGSIVFKSSIRFLGTLSGSLLAALTIIGFHNSPLMNALVIAFVGILASYLATSQSNYRDAATLGAVTTAIILINPQPTLTLTLERFTEISIGIIIATLISHFILPIHARNHLKQAQAQALKLLREYYTQATRNTFNEENKTRKLDEAIVQSLIIQRKLADEAKRELLGSRFDSQYFKTLMECEKQILRSLDFLDRIYHELSLEQLIQDQGEWQKFNQVILNIFSTIIQVIENSALLPALDFPSTQDIKNSLSKENAYPDQLKNIETFLFCLDNMIKQLKELAALVG